MRTPLSILKDLWARKDKNEPVGEYILKLLEGFKNMREIVDILRIEAKRKSKQYYDRNAREVSCKEGDQVMLYKPCRTNQLQMQWTGPKKIKILPLITLLKKLPANGTKLLGT